MQQTKPSLSSTANTRRKLSLSELRSEYLDIEPPSYVRFAHHHPSPSTFEIEQSMPSTPGSAKKHLTLHVVVTNGFVLSQHSSSRSSEGHSSGVLYADDDACNALGDSILDAAQEFASNSSKERDDNFAQECVQKGLRCLFNLHADRLPKYTDDWTEVVPRKVYVRTPFYEWVPGVHMKTLYGRLSVLESQDPEANTINQFAVTIMNDSVGLEKREIYDYLMDYVEGKRHSGIQDEEET